MYYKQFALIMLIKATVSGKLVSAPPPASNLAPARILSLLSLSCQNLNVIHKITTVFEIHALTSSIMHCFDFLTYLQTYLIIES